MSSTNLAGSSSAAGAVDIGQVVSDVRDRLPGLEAPPQFEPEQAHAAPRSAETQCPAKLGQAKLPLLAVLVRLFHRTRCRKLARTQGV